MNNRRPQDRATQSGTEGQACLDPEVVAAFLGQRLAADETAALESHIAVCADCRQLISMLVRSGRSEAAARATGATGAGTTLPRAGGAADVGVAMGASIGRYVVLERLGSGGMGVVYSAHDRQLDRKVALKVLRHDALDEDHRRSLRNRLQREARAMAQLAHPNVVAVYDVGTFGEQIFVAMEQIDGETLDQWLTKNPRPIREILDRFSSAGRGLVAAHAAGLVHRDFKPANVLIGNDNRVRVVDFGLAARTAAAEPTSGITPGGAQPPVIGSATRTLTETGALVGTPYYMAPEQLRGEPVDPRTDQFSFCVALYTAITGEHPFVIGPEGLVVAVLEARLRPRPRRGVMPPRLHRVLVRGLATRPEERYPSMTELLAALASRSAPRLRRALATAGVAAALAVGIAVGLSVRWLQPAELPAPRAITAGVAPSPPPPAPAGAEVPTRAPASSGSAKQRRRGSAPASVGAAKTSTKSPPATPPARARGILGGDLDRSFDARAPNLVGGDVDRKFDAN